jgi:hypothetical protein
MENIFSTEFPDRKRLVEEFKNKSNNYIDQIVEQVKDIDLNKIDYSDTNFKPRSEITEKQKEFFWIRLFLNDEDTSLTQGDDITIKDLVYDEELEVKYMFYGKKNLHKDADNIINYDPEEDKKCLVLMIDTDKVNQNSEHIPYIRSLFTNSRYFSHQIIRIEDLEFVVKKTGEKLKYYSVDF